MKTLKVAYNNIYGGFDHVYEYKMHSTINKERNDIRNISK